MSINMTLDNAHLRSQKYLPDRKFATDLFSSAHDAELMNCKIYVSSYISYSALVFVLVSCVVKLMRNVNITERQSLLYEKMMMTFSRKNLDFFTPGLGDALMPLVLGKDLDKADLFLECLRK